MRRLSAIAALCLACALSANAQRRIVLHVGAVKGNSYNNPSLGISYQFPEGWVAETPAVSGQGDAVTLLFAHPADAKANRFVRLQATPIQRVPEAQRDPREFLQEQVRTLNRDVDTKDEIVGAIQAVEIGDRDFMRAQIRRSGTPGRSDFFTATAGAVNGVMLLLETEGVSDADASELADTADSLSFSPPEGIEEAPPAPVIVHQDPNAVKRISVPEGTARARVRKQVEPQYPPDARDRRVEGEVLIEVVVGTDGSVVEANVVSGHPLLNDAALAAVRQWKFDPYLIDGRAVEIDTRIRITFSLVSAKTSS